MTSAGPANGSRVRSTVVEKGTGTVIEQYDRERVKVEWDGGDAEMEFRDELEAVR